MQNTVIGNWKMHGTLESAAALASGISGYTSASDLRRTKVVLCPSALHLAAVLEQVQGSPVGVGGQNCHDQEKGAHTGDVSAVMLADTGAGYVILGHSERRAGYKENNVLVAQKAVAAKAAGLIPVICIGETLEERESGAYTQVLAEQAQQSVPEGFTSDDFILAYEPVWAIGTGKVADNDTIRDTHALVAKNLPEGSAILYGGSVKPDNAEAIMKINHVDGVLVGGASLQVESFAAIIAASEKE